MKKKRSKKRLIFFQATLLLFLILFTVQVSAINMPFIDIQEETEEGETEEITGEPVDDTEETDPPEEEPPPQEEITPEVEDNSSDILFENEIDESAPSEAGSGQAALSSRKKGCGSVIPGSGMIAILMIGVIEIFLMRKGKQDERTN